MKEFREKEEKELRQVLAAAQAEISQLRGKRAIGSLANTSAISKKRREAARVMTALGEKEILKEVAQVEEKQNGRPPKAD
ncbi:MAG TPA: 50S ribosomal protein L29 [Patescibacteria group bacterium]|nr:50S ribosomal protein L29 [Patescibacteria group bacterium]